MATAADILNGVNACYLIAYLKQSKDGFTVRMLKIPFNQGLKKGGKGAAEIRANKANGDKGREFHLSHLCLRFG